jgi:serine/threonine-protein kinase
MGIPGAAPARLGRYELLARLATGGMGEIFLARMEGAAGFEKLFVIKRILPHLADDVRFRDMLIGEARIASMMTHANICQVYELGETDGQLYIVMEHLEGITVLPMLRKLSKEGGALDLGFIGGVIQQATDGLHYAHELKDRGGDYLGIVHRDVTPSNIFLTDSGVVKVLDFGIAKVKDASAHTQTGTVKGKYAYMAPEQLRGAVADRRADVFALGVVVYEMLALRRLFQRKTDYLTFRAVMEQPIMDIRHYRPDCPDPLAAALAHALDRDPDNRYTTARQFGSAVLDAISGLRRPWSHGEISDYVAVNFADDLRRRSAQISSAVETGAMRQTMPLIAQPDDEEIELEDGEFPPVDSAVAATVGGEDRARGPTGPRAAQRRPTGEHTPIREATGSGPELDALRGVPGGVSQQQPIVVVSPRRSLVWPLIAFAMVAVAGGALFLVWRQMENQPPTSLVITNATDGQVKKIGSGVISVGHDPADPTPADPTWPDPPSEPHGDTPGKAAGRPKRAIDPYLAVVHKKKGDVDGCASAHGNPPPGTRVVIIVAADGRAKRVAVEPKTVDATPFGSCIKTVFRGTVFPHGDDDHELEIKLRPA